MAAPIKNNFWQLRETHGRDKIFSSKEELWGEACKYFRWCDTHPLKEQKVFGTGMRMNVKHPRPYTIKALCFYLGIGWSTWNDYKTKPEYEDFSNIIEAIEQITFSQKFEGAAVGFFNANLISRELGLIDKTEIDFNKLSDKQLDEIIDKIKNGN
jgi:hypothetical protein